MKNMVRALFIACLIFGAQARHNSANSVIAFIDMTGKTPASYRVLFELGRAAGITFKHVVPHPNLAEDLCGCNGAFLLVDDQFFTHTYTAYAKLALDPLRVFARQPGKLIGLILPGRLFSQAWSVPLAATLDQELGIVPDLAAFKKFLLYTIKTAPSYATAGTLSRRLRPAELTPTKNATWLPSRIVPGPARGLAPLGALITCNDHRKLFVTTDSRFLFAELSEDAATNPLRPHIRRKLLKALTDTLFAIHQQLCINRQPRLAKPNYHAIAKLTDTQNADQADYYKAQEGIYRWTNNGINCGWLGLDCATIALLPAAHFDMLWLELPMSEYANNRAQFDRQVTKFSHDLKQAYAQAHMPLPKLFLDFDLASMTKRIKFIQHPIDLYGIQYRGVPAPLDYEGFWKPIILQELKEVCKAWQQTTGSGLPINGILINFYFWSDRHGMPFYSGIVDVSDTAWQAYTHQLNITDQFNQWPIEKRIGYILENHKIAEYAQALEKAARNLAQVILRDIKTVAACSMVAAYTDTPRDAWFYRGIMSGFSKPEAPVLWFTNNISFYSHKNWLKQHQIYALHATAVQLQHFNRLADVRTLNKLAKTHDGLWYSRASRIGQRYEPDKWWTAEATTMSSKELVKRISKQANKR